MIELIIAQAADWFALLCGTLGAIVILYGAARAFYSFIREMIGHARLDSIRIHFGRYLALGLEFFIVKDILELMFVPSWTELGQLLVLVVIRTMISYFLMHEIERVKR